MQIRSLKLKSKLTDIDNEQYLDLTQSSMKECDVTIKSVYVVTKQTEMRIDLISYIFYGTTEYIDVICKANNIFNPFDIKDGDVLAIPDVLSDEKIYQSPPDAEKKDLRTNYTDSSRMSQQDKDKIKALTEKVKGRKGAVNNPLPPNMLQPDESSKEFKNNKIIFGSNFNLIPRKNA